MPDDATVAEGKNLNVMPKTYKNCYDRIMDGDQAGYEVDRFAVNTLQVYGNFQANTSGIPTAFIWSTNYVLNVHRFIMVASGSVLADGAKSVSTANPLPFTGTTTYAYGSNGGGGSDPANTVLANTTAVFPFGMRVVTTKDLFVIADVSSDITTSPDITSTFTSGFTLNGYLRFRSDATSTTTAAMAGTFAYGVIPDLSDLMTLLVPQIESNAMGAKTTLANVKVQEGVRFIGVNPDFEMRPFSSYQRSNCLDSHSYCFPSVNGSITVNTGMTRWVNPPFYDVTGLNSSPPDTLLPTDIPFWNMVGAGNAMWFSPYTAAVFGIGNNTVETFNHVANALQAIAYTNNLSSAYSFFVQPPSPFDSVTFDITVQPSATKAPSNAYLGDVQVIHYYASSIITDATPQTTALNIVTTQENFAVNVVPSTFSYAEFVSGTNPAILGSCNPSVDEGYSNGAVMKFRTTAALPDANHMWIGSIVHPIRSGVQWANVQSQYSSTLLNAYTESLAVSANPYVLTVAHDNNQVLVFTGSPSSSLTQVVTLPSTTTGSPPATVGTKFFFQGQASSINVTYNVNYQDGTLWLDLSGGRSNLLVFTCTGVGTANGTWSSDTISSDGNYPYDGQVDITVTNVDYWVNNRTESSRSGPYHVIRADNVASGQSIQVDGKIHYAANANTTLAPYVNRGRGERTVNWESLWTPEIAELMTALFYDPMLTQFPLAAKFRVYEAAIRELRKADVDTFLTYILGRASPQVVTQARAAGLWDHAKELAMNPKFLSAIVKAVVAAIEAKGGLRERGTAAVGSLYNSATSSSIPKNFVRKNTYSGYND